MKTFGKRCLSSFFLLFILFLCLPFPAYTGSLKQKLFPRRESPQSTSVSTTGTCNENEEEEKKPKPDFVKSKADCIGSNSVLQTFVSKLKDIKLKEGIHLAKKTKTSLDKLIEKIIRNPKNFQGIQTALNQAKKEVLANLKKTDNMNEDQKDDQGRALAGFLILLLQISIALDAEVSQKTFMKNFIPPTQEQTNQQTVKVEPLDTVEKAQEEYQTTIQNDVARGFDTFEASQTSHRIQLFHNCQKKQEEQVGTIKDLKAFLEALPQIDFAFKAPTEDSTHLTNHQAAQELLAKIQAEKNLSNQFWIHALRMNTQNTDVALILDLMKNHPKFSTLLSQKHRHITADGQAVTYFLIFQRRREEPPAPDYSKPPFILIKTSDCTTYEGCQQFTYTIQPLK